MIFQDGLFCSKNACTLGLGPLTVKAHCHKLQTVANLLLKKTVPKIKI